MPTTLSFDIARQAANNAGVPSTAAVQLIGQSWVFYDAVRVAQLNPSFSAMSAGQQQQFLLTGAPGVLLIVPPQPDYIPPPPASTGTTPPPVTNPPVYQGGSVNLATIVDVSKRIITRDYVKNTMTAIPKETLNFRNTSGDITVQVGLTGTQGVSYSPNVFSLQPRGEQLVDVLFDVVQINQLVEGTSTIATVMNLTSPTVITGPSTPVPPPVQQPPAATPPVPAIGQWLEERFQGTPNTQSEAQIFSRAPIFTQTVWNISYNGTLPSDTTTRWTKVDNFEDGDHLLEAVSEDGMKVIVAGRTVFNAWRDQPRSSFSTTVNLSPGLQTIVVMNYTSGGQGTAIFGLQYIQQPNEEPLPPSPVSPPPQLEVPRFPNEPRRPIPGDGEVPDPVNVDPPQSPPEVIFTPPETPYVEPVVPPVPQEPAPYTPYYPPGSGGYGGGGGDGGGDIPRNVDEEGQLDRNIG